MIGSSPIPLSVTQHCFVVRFTSVHCYYSDNLQVWNDTCEFDPFCGNGARRVLISQAGDDGHGRAYREKRAMSSIR